MPSLAHLPRGQSHLSACCCVFLTGVHLATVVFLCSVGSVYHSRVNIPWLDKSYHQNHSSESLTKHDNVKYARGQNHQHCQQAGHWSVKLGYGDSHEACSTVSGVFDCSPYMVSTTIKQCYCQRGRHQDVRSVGTISRISESVVAYNYPSTLSPAATCLMRSAFPQDLRRSSIQSQWTRLSLRS
jgi:hypothetical protein